MEIELIGALDYKKVKKLLESEIGTILADKYEDLNEKEKSMVDQKVRTLLKEIKNVEKVRHSEIVSTAGRLSRFPGDVREVLELSENKEEEKNKNFASRVIGMGHKSISDHDYLVFSLKNVSVIIEQMIIEERIASFTIKSRREVDFSNSGYYTPRFYYNKDGELLENSSDLQYVYDNHMKRLFDGYSKLIENGVSKEDARFVLPYSFHSNIIMGVDAHTLMDMIIKFTKTKYSRVQEFKEFGDKLYKIAKENVPYITDIIDKIEVKENDAVDEYLNDKIKREDYKILDQVKLLTSSKDIDDQILISAIMRRYQYDLEKATRVYNELCNEDPNFKLELMRKIAFESDKGELTQVNFDFQIPVSFAILTHLTRHRTHKMLIPDFFPTVDLTQYKTPPKIVGDNKVLYDSLFKNNYDMYDIFRRNSVREEDLIYFTLSGNMVNILTNMDGWTVRHILELRECNKAQWETREIARGIHSEIAKLENASIFEQILGPTCETQLICNEGKESCGKINVLKKAKK